MAAGAGRGDNLECGATDVAIRLPMLMPLLVRLTDSEVDAAGSVVAKAANGVKDDGGILE
jgi:hypothetical protein